MGKAKILKQRIDHAIEFIETTTEDNEFIHTDYLYRMINILKGSDSND